MGAGGTWPTEDGVDCDCEIWKPTGDEVLLLRYRMHAVLEAIDATGGGIASFTATLVPPELWRLLWQFAHEAVAEPELMVCDAHGTCTLCDEYGKADPLPGHGQYGY